MLRKGYFKSIPALLALALLALIATACKPSAERLNEEGNEHFAQEAYLDAIAAYQSAQMTSPELAELYYNAANALYRQGDFANAQTQLEQALQFAAQEPSATPALAENSFFNMGNASFNQEAWEGAVAAYREALLRNPDDTDAKYNLELALQQLQQQEQQNEEQEQQDEEQDQPEEGESQENESEQSEGGEQDQPQNGEEGDQEQDQNQDQSENGEGQEGQEESEQDQNQSGENDGSEQDGQEPENGEGQQGDQEQQDQGNASQNGQEPAQDGASQNYVPAPGQRMTADQARQLLAAIAAESGTLQERLGQIFMVPFGPPMQDW